MLKLFPASDKGEVSFVLALFLNTRCPDVTGSLLTFLLVHPDWTRMAKSPISCGTSCRRMVMVVTTPTAGPTRKEAPMARPSVKLWVKSAARFR